MHYSCIVILPEGTKREDTEAALTKALAPFGMDLDVPEYETKCDCIGIVAFRAAREEADSKFGTWDECHRNFVDRHPNLPFGDTYLRLWQEHIAPREELEKKVRLSHPMAEKPDPECRYCHGSGRVMAIENPMGYWDWYSIGGRWTGLIDGYDPDIAPVTACIERKTVPFVVVTPDGKWNTMRAWRTEEEEKDEAKWAEEVLSLYERHKQCIAVVVDIHS